MPQNFFFFLFLSFILDMDVSKAWKLYEKGKLAHELSTKFKKKRLRYIKGNSNDHWMSFVFEWSLFIRNWYQILNVFFVGKYVGGGNITWKCLFGYCYYYVVVVVVENNDRRELCVYICISVCSFFPVILRFNVQIINIFVWGFIPTK